MTLRASASPITVGMFDSGVGGLSVLRALRRQLPAARLIYVADSGFAPYGERGDAYVIRRSHLITDFLLHQGAQAVVVACNTATAAAAKSLRAAHPQVPMIGIEPGLKPAVAHSAARRIGVMATSGTLASVKFQALLEAFRGEAEIHLQPCPGLAHAIEQGDPHAPEVLALVQRYGAPLRDAGVDTVVLGCTHYPFVADAIQQVLGPGVRLIDTADAVARHTVTQVLKAVHPLPATEPGPVQAHTSGDVGRLAAITAQWLDFPVCIAPLPAH